MFKKVILCCSPKNKIRVELIFLPPTSQKPPENFDCTVYCSLTDDISKTPSKPQQKLIESRKFNERSSLVASAPYNIFLPTAINASQTIEISNNLSLVPGTAIETNIDIKNPTINVFIDESSTLYQWIVWK